MSNSDFPENDNPEDFDSDADIAAEIAAAEGRDYDAPEGREAGSGASSGKLEEELATAKDQVLRLAAELENTRRRAARDKTDAAKYAIANFARDLLSVADNFERAMSVVPEGEKQASPETFENLVTGLRMTDNELRAVLQRHGVKQIHPKGEKFDPNLHQAVSQMPSDVPSGHVAEVAQTGFTIGERVLRAAMVVVSTGGGARNEDAPGSHVDEQA